MSASKISGVTPKTTVGELIESATGKPSTTKLEPCYYTFTGKLCPGPNYNQCPAGSRCDIDVGACVAPAPGRTDCITDYSKRGPLPQGAGVGSAPGNNGTAGNGGGRSRYGSRKMMRSSKSRSRKMRRKH
jgi:hypothetical protein